MHSYELGSRAAIEQQQALLAARRGAIEGPAHVGQPTDGSSAVLRRRLAWRVGRGMLRMAGWLLRYGRPAEQQARALRERSAQLN